MAEPLDPKNIDKRTAARHPAQGELDEKAWERYLKSLPDVSERLRRWRPWWPTRTSTKT